MNAIRTPQPVQGTRGINQLVQGGVFAPENVSLPSVAPSGRQSTGARMIDERHPHATTSNKGRGVSINRCKGAGRQSTGARGRFYAHQANLPCAPRHCVVVMAHPRSSAPTAHPNASPGQRPRFQGNKYPSPERAAHPGNASYLAAFIKPFS